MNLQSLNSDHAEASQTSDWTSNPLNASGGRPIGREPSSSRPSHLPRPSLKASSHSTTRQEQREQRRHRRNRSAPARADNSLAAQPAVVPQAPSPPSQTDEAYLPGRLLSSSPISSLGYHDIDSRIQTPRPPAVHFDEAQLAHVAADNAARMVSINVKDELAMAAGRVTPGIDDTPYIQYALQALNGAHGSSLPPHLDAEASESASERNYPSLGMGGGMGGGIGDVGTALLPITYPQIAGQDLGVIYGPSALPGLGAAQLESIAQRSPKTFIPRPISAGQDPTMGASNRWIPVTRNMRHDIDPLSRTYQPLTFRPRILKPFSLIMFMILCLLMTIALIFSAVYSDSHDGLTPYPGTINSGQYFVFRILPQLLSAIIFIYAQCILTTSLRMLPFAALADEDSRKRYMALFLRLYTMTPLMPTLVGPWQFRLFSLATWLAMFTIPLQSSAFACILVDDRWIWASVQGVVWTLVVLYLALFLSAAVLTTYWFRRWTGLIWDVRSVGDLLPLLNGSNGMESYRRGGVAEESAELRAQLHERWFDRLGYWQAEDTVAGGIWYTIGTSGHEHCPTAPPSWMGKKASNEPSFDKGEPGAAGDSRRRYLPWCLRDAPILVSVAGATLLLLALLIVSFLPQTRLESGFFAGVTAKPNGSAFSPANFIFSFVPSSLGMVLYLLFQGIDQALRIQQPWAELCAAEGSPARKSLLVDYAACLPLQSTWRSAKNGHWRASGVSFLAALFVFLPILGGGFLMALTGADGRVRMYPSMPTFGVLLALSFLYVGGLSVVVPHRKGLMTPRPVTCIAEMASLCSGEELAKDAAFRGVRSREDLEGRLGVGLGEEESVWMLGVVADGHRLSVQRVGGEKGG